MNIKQFAKKFAKQTILSSHNDYKTIQNDVNRTLHGIAHIPREEFERNLTTTLHLFVSTYPEFGYIQGMNEVAGIFYLVFEDHLEAYYGLCSLYEKYNLSLIWSVELLIEKVKPAIEEKIKSECKLIHNKMLQLDVQCFEFVPKMCIPLFLQASNKLSCRLHIMDWLLVGGLKILRNLIVGILKQKEKKLLESKSNTDFLTILFQANEDIVTISDYVNIFSGCKNRHVDCSLVLSGKSRSSAQVWV